MTEQILEIIEFDIDTIDIDGNIYESLYPYDPSFSDIEMLETPFTVFEYLRKYKQGKIIIQPDFQRNLVWTNEKKSRFVELILLNFPLPPIYLNETINGKYLIIDGLQRTTAIYQFYNNEIVLSNLEALPQYNKYHFNEFPDALKSKFEDKKLTIYILKPSTPMKVVYDLFNRINTGGTQLNRQEVRNCIFIGKSTKLLKELSEKEYFKEAISYGIKDTRMKDREAVLRYISFRWFDYKKEYSGDLSNYIENVMKKINTIDDDTIDKMRNDFKRVMKWTYKIWKNANFRIPTEHTRGMINIAVFESVCNYIASKTDIFLDKNKIQIKKNYSKLITNPEFYESVTRSTGNKQRVFDRFRLANEILNINCHD